MKTKKIILFALVAVLSCPVFSQSSLSERTQNWTKETPVTREGSGPGTGTGPGGPGNPGGPGTPIGETTWALILGLGSIYGAYVFNRKRKATNE